MFKTRLRKTLVVVGSLVFILFLISSLKFSRRTEWYYDTSTGVTYTCFDVRIYFRYLRLNQECSVDLYRNTKTSVWSHSLYAKYLEENKIERPFKGLLLGDVDLITYWPRNSINSVGGGVGGGISRDIDYFLKTYTREKNIALKDIPVDIVEKKVAEFEVLVHSHFYYPSAFTRPPPDSGISEKEQKEQKEQYTNIYNVLKDVAKNLPKPEDY
jgi:hypothetical protein